MKVFFLILSISAFSLQSLAFDQNQVKECKSKFDDVISEDMELKFVCKDPTTVDSRSEFIALQYSATQYDEDDQKVYQQIVIICASNTRSASINQSNDLISGVGLLKIIGSDANEIYLNMISAQNKSTLKELSQANCTDSQGNLLVD